MKTNPHFPAAPLLAALACIAISAPVAHAQDDAIGIMDVDGSNAFVDNIRQPASGSGIRILDGNLVRTGQDTSALVAIIPEGSVQLNENSAKLITASFFKGARCFAVRLITGELFINGENVCFLTNVGAVSGISHSRINLEVDARGTVLTVIEGAAELDVRPASMTVSASEQLVVLPSGEYSKTVLDPAAAERTAEWTKDYFNAPPAERTEGMSTGTKTALGILGAIILGKAIHEATDDDDRGRDRDDRRSPPAQPPPEDASPPSDTPRPPRRTQPPAGTVRRPYPVRQPQPDACCVAGTTYRLTPAQCKARGGERGACRVIK